MNSLTKDRRAFLHWIRNVEAGLVSRSEILAQLDMDVWKSTSEIAENVRVKAATVLYHLHNMERENVVERSEDGFGWKLAPIQQSSLVEFLKPKRKRRIKK